MQVQKDSVVSIHVTLTDASGNVIQSSQGQDPVDYLHGHGNIVSGLEEALEGAVVGSELEVSVPPEKAYGGFSPEWVQRVPRSSFGAVEQIEVGMAFVADTEEGERQFVVTAVEDEQIEVNGNHPLAGETLHYSVRVEALRGSTDAEREQGHIEVANTCQKSGCCD